MWTSLNAKNMVYNCGRQEETRRGRQELDIKKKKKPRRQMFSEPRSKRNNIFYTLLDETNFSVSKKKPRMKMRKMRKESV